MTTSTPKLSMTNSAEQNVNYILARRAQGADDAEIQREIAAETYKNSYAIRELFEMADNPEVLDAWTRECQLHDERKARKEAGPRTMTTKNLRKHAEAKRGEKNTGKVLKFHPLESEYTSSFSPSSFVRR